MTIEDELAEATTGYKAFLAGGGNRGSAAGRRWRERLGALIAEVKDERARSERIDFEAEEKALAHIDVFGDGE